MPAASWYCQRYRTAFAQVDCTSLGFRLSPSCSTRKNSGFDECGLRNRISLAVLFDSISVAVLLNHISRAVSFNRICLAVRFSLIAHMECFNSCGWCKWLVQIPWPVFTYVLDSARNFDWATAHQAIQKEGRKSCIALIRRVCCSNKPTYTWIEGILCLLCHNCANMAAQAHTIHHVFELSTAGKCEGSKFCSCIWI